MFLSLPDTCLLLLRVGPRKTFPYVLTLMDEAVIVSNHCLRTGDLNDNMRGIRQFFGIPWVYMGHGQAVPRGLMAVHAVRR